MELLDAVVEALTRAEVITILNNHVSTAQWCCHPEDGLWYTEKVRHLQTFNKTNYVFKASTLLCNLFIVCSGYQIVKPRPQTPKPQTHSQTQNQGALG